MGNQPYQGPDGMPYRKLLGYGASVEDAESETLTGNRKAPVKKSAKRPWTEEEDESLVKGYQKHGFRWKDIASDASLALRTRSGNQIRDRFRKRFPEAYAGAPPPLKEPVQLGEIKNPGSTALKTTNITTDVNNQKVGAVDEDDEESDREKQPATLSSTANKQIPSAPAPYGINGLLNTEDEDNRPSSFRYDDWEENVTLPPLLWEDMCPKPIFELD